MNKNTKKDTRKTPLTTVAAALNLAERIRHHADDRHREQRAQLAYQRGNADILEGLLQGNAQ